MGEHRSRLWKRATFARGLAAGVVASHVCKGETRQHGKPDVAGSEIPAGNPRGTGRAAAGGGKVRCSDEASNDRGANGP